MMNAEGRANPPAEPFFWVFRGRAFFPPRTAWSRRADGIPTALCDLDISLLTSGFPRRPEQKGFHGRCSPAFSRTGSSDIAGPLFNSIFLILPSHFPPYPGWLGPAGQAGSLPRFAPSMG